MEKRNEKALFMVDTIKGTYMYCLWIVDGYVSLFPFYKFDLVTHRRGAKKKKNGIEKGEGQERNNGNMRQPHSN